jgi:transposase
VRLVREHRAEYSSTTAAARRWSASWARGTESVRLWVVQADIDGGLRPGTSSEESTEIRNLKAENRRLREDVEILRATTTIPEKVGTSSGARIPSSCGAPEITIYGCGASTASSVK